MDVRVYQPSLDLILAGTEFCKNLKNGRKFFEGGEDDRGGMFSMYGAPICYPCYENPDYCTTIGFINLGPLVWSTMAVQALDKYFL